MTQNRFAGMSDAHKRGISITLVILDETLCEVEQWAKGREMQSVFYKEHNALSTRQRQKMLSEIAEMRSLLQEMRDAIGIEPTVEDAGDAIRGKCSGLWEHIVELKAKHLRRYGEAPAGLGEYLDPRAEQLIQGIYTSWTPSRYEGASLAGVRRQSSVHEYDAPRQAICVDQRKFS